MQKVFLRADGNAEIGLGHLVRSIALGSMITETYDCTLYTRFTNTFIENEAAKSGISVSPLPASNDHFNSFLEILSGDEIVILDNYFFNSDYQKKIKGKGCGLVCIDDIHNQHFYSDLLINQSPAVRESDYEAESYTHLLLGLDYAILRPEFQNFNQFENGKKPTDHVMVCFGGSDYQNVTQRVLDQLIQLDMFNEISVVVGPRYNHLDDLNRRISNSEISIYRAIDAGHMARLINDSGICIVPASGVLIEVMAMRKPFLTGYYAENQMSISNYFKSLDPRVVCDDFNQVELSAKKFADLDPFPSHLLDKVDGKASLRFLEAFEKVWGRG